jgi:hypothetical protein
MHHHDLPLPIVLRHYEVQQTMAIGPWISFGIDHASHIPRHIHRRNIGTNEPGPDGGLP